MSTEFSVFPNADQYPAIRHRWAAREHATGGQNDTFCERHLHCIWYDPVYRPARLVSADGEKVLVIDPGRWNLEAGPDFLDAELDIGPESRRVRGDVEIHIHSEDWTRHDHARDPRYAKVVAHVTYWPGRLEKQHLPPGTLQISLREPLQRIPDFYFSNIDTSVYPYNTPAALKDALPQAWQSYTIDEKRAIVRSAGEARLMSKTNVFRSAIQAYGPDQALWESMLGALGYKHNRTPFRALARALPIAELRERAKSDPFAAYALLVGVSGLLPSNLDPDWHQDVQKFVRGLWDAWWRVQDPMAFRSMSPDVWQRSHLRPQNQPIRRMAAAASLATATRTPSEFLRACEPADALASLRILDQWLNIENDMFIWNRHLTLASQPVGQTLALVGPARRAAIITNVLVPFLAAMDIDVSTWISVLPPEEDSHPVKLCAVALFGVDHNSAEYRHGIMQQGLIQIFHDYIVNAARLVS